MRRRLLILVDWFEPGFKAGGPIQSCASLVRALQNEFDVYVLTSDRDWGDAEPYEGIEYNTWTTAGPHTKVYYASVARLNKSATAKIISEVDPHCVYLNSMYSWHFTIMPLMLKRTGAVKCPVIVAPRGMLQSGAMQFKSRKKKLFLAFLRVTGAASRIFFHATDDEERKDIQTYFPRSRGIHVIGNIPSLSGVQRQHTPKERNKLQLVFLSRIAAKKNLLFLLQLLKAIKPSFTIDLHVFGESEDQVYLQKCKEAASQLPKHIQVKWRGALPNREIPAAYSDLHVFVLPTFGENFGHAIYEALALGKPVIISDKTPWRNLENRKIGFDLPLDQPAQFRDAIEQFAAMDQHQYDDWSKSAHTFAAGHINYNQLKAEYLELFSEQFLKP